jgi:superfamily II DNA/RNA helicase
VATEFVLKLLKKRLFSSPEAFARTLEAHTRSLVRPSKRTRAPRPAAGILRRQIARVDEEFGNDEAADSASQEALDVATRVFSPPSDTEQALLEQLNAWAQRARGRPDSKAHALLAWLRAALRPQGVCKDERVIIFTEYRDTQRWLLDILASADFGGRDAVLTLHGGMPQDERERVKAAFQTGPDEFKARILLATDAASEGIDLQNHYSRLIHVEIPWNPNRLEQRNGRIDRHGQRAAEVHIYHFVSQRWRQATIGESGSELAEDLEFLFRAAQKVEQIREDLGKVGPVIAEQVERAMLRGQRTLDTVRDEQGAARCVSS